MGNWKHFEAAKLALLGFTVLMFCSSTAELNNAMDGVNKELGRLIYFNEMEKDGVQIRFKKSLKRIDVGNGWIRFEVTSRNAGRGLMVDYAFVDDLADYQNWFKQYCTLETPKMRNIGEQAQPTNERLR